jgi:hypothetical protein
MDFFHSSVYPLKLANTCALALVEATILLAASRHNGTNVVRDAATLYKVDTDAIVSKVKQEFAAKLKPRSSRMKRTSLPAARLRLRRLKGSSRCVSAPTRPRAWLTCSSIISPSSSRPARQQIAPYATL